MVAAAAAAAPPPPATPKHHKAGGPPNTVVNQSRGESVHDGRAARTVSPRYFFLLVVGYFSHYSRHHDEVVVEMGVVTAVVHLEAVRRVEKVVVDIVPAGAVVVVDALDSRNPRGAQSL